MREVSNTFSEPKRGDHVRVRCADGSVRPKRALSGVIGVDVDFPVVWVCDLDEYPREALYSYPPPRGRRKAGGRPWPSEDVGVVL